MSDYNVSRRTEYWTQGGIRLVVIDFDHNNCVIVTREALVELLEQAGFYQTTLDKPVDGVVESVPQDDLNDYHNRS